MHRENFLCQRQAVACVRLDFDQQSRRNDLVVINEYEPFGTQTIEHVADATALQLRQRGMADQQPRRQAGEAPQRWLHCNPIEVDGAGRGSTSGP